MKQWPFKVVNVMDKPKLEVEYKSETRFFTPEFAVMALDATGHGLENAAMVKFNEIMVSLHTFKIDTTGLIQYESGGVVVQVKQPKVLHFKFTEGDNTQRV